MRVSPRLPRAVVPASRHSNTCETINPMNRVVYLLPTVLPLLASCTHEPPISDSESAEFQQVAEDFQRLYVDGAENCARILPTIAEDVEMVENGQVWTHADLEQYCPHLLKKRVVESWSDHALLGPELAYDFTSVVFENDAGGRGRETTARVWAKRAGRWSIVRMNNVVGPVPAEDASRR